mmetsp:Transcript_28078/g.41034  ORF Transcript_28078/g.41034 Transcript_28078/m.41034 type:complete len:259 (-) Transcript_28078:502-1278(-)
MAFVNTRGLLSFIWSIINMITFISYIIAFLFTYSADNNNNNANNNNDDQQNARIIEVAVTSRAMAFSSLWTAVLAVILAVFGTIVLGFQSPTGEYYACCLGNVHETTPTSLGSFVGCLIMFANLTFVCALLFGEFEVRDYSDYQREGQDNNGDDNIQRYNTAADRSSLAFSVVCSIMTIMYFSFAAMVYACSDSILEENLADAMEDSTPKSVTTGGVTLHPGIGVLNQSGYLVSNQFGARPLTKSVVGGFVTQSDSLG